MTRGESRPRSSHDLEDAEITALIKQVHEERQGRLGIGRIMVELAKLGFRHSAKRVRRLARAAGAVQRASQALQGHHGPRRRRLGRPRRARLRARRPRRAVVHRHHLYIHVGGVGVSGRDHRRVFPESRRLGRRQADDASLPVWRSGWRSGWRPGWRPGSGWRPGWRLGNGWVWLRYALAVRSAARHGLLPKRPARFLDWCLDTGLMRMAGNALQFRHRQLQNWLITSQRPSVESVDGPQVGRERAD
jgi:hypothetical protein